MGVGSWDWRTVRGVAVWACADASGGAGSGIDGEFALQVICARVLRVLRMMSADLAQCGVPRREKGLLRALECRRHVDWL